MDADCRIPNNRDQETARIRDPVESSIDLFGPFGGVTSVFPRTTSVHTVSLSSRLSESPTTAPARSSYASRATASGVSNISPGSSSVHFKTPSPRNSVSPTTASAVHYELYFANWSGQILDFVQTLYGE